MLESLPAESRDAVVFRFANPYNDVRALTALGLDQDAIDDMMGHLASFMLAPGSVDRLVDGSFEPWNAHGPPYGSPTRFSDGTWPVFYTALEVQTAENEIKYHRGKDFFVRKNRQRTVYYHLVEIIYHGKTVDLCRCVGQWPHLIEAEESAYPSCQIIGNEAVKLGICGLLTTSARRPSGTNLPVFIRAAIVEALPRTLAAFVANPVTGEIEVVWHP